MKEIAALIESSQSSKFTVHSSKVKGQRGIRKVSDPVMNRAVMKTSLVKTAVRIAAILAAALVLCLSAAIRTSAASDFIIRDYAVNMTVNEDDTYMIRETVKVEFTAPSHGIYVSIPLRADLDRDGQRSQYAVKVRDFRLLSDQPYETENSDGEFRVRIGDPDEYAPTETTYRYSYLYDTGGDHLKDADEVYHNLVGTSWEAQSIDHVSFEVVFPKDIDMGNVGIKTSGQVRVPFEAADGRTVQGETTEDCLGGLTVRAVLPEGYFTRQAKSPVAALYIVDALLMLLAAAAAIMAKRYGKDPDCPETLEFYPPEGITAPEAAYIMNEDVSGKEIISLLFSLADKGYVKIHEYGEESRIRHKIKEKYRIEKLRDYDGDNPYEEMFMDGLFEDGDAVEVEDLENEFYKTADRIRDAIIEDYKPKFYDEKAGSKAAMIKMIGAAGLFVLMAVMSFTSPETAGSGLLGKVTWFVIPLALMIIGFFRLSDAIRARKGARRYLAPLLPLLAGLFMSYAYLSSWQTVPFAAGIILVFLIFVLAGFCDRKTGYFAGMQARVKGYAEFLRTAEKDQMDTLAEKDPDYFYRNLAYAFALGVTAAYAKRFAQMAMKDPDWYTSDIHSFGRSGATRMVDSVSSMANSIGSSMSSSPSSGSGGGSFSGGGGGGGSGGGSW